MVNALDLESFGLTRNEAKVYWSLLKLGASPAADIGRESGLHRVVVYDVLERLTEKAMVGTVTRNQKKIFEAAPPDELLERLKRAEETIAENKRRYEEMQETLNRMYVHAGEKSSVYFFKGKKGIKAALLHMVGENKPIFSIGSSGRTRELLGPDFKVIRETIEKKKIPIKMLYYSSTRNKDIGFKHAELRFLSDEYQNPMLIHITGNVTIITMLDTEPFAILIRNQSTAESFVRHFEYFWKLATP
jgi:sugar-specific transcriptional regulator TrmB